MQKTTLESVAKILVINSENKVLVLTTGEYKTFPEKSYKPDLPGGLVDPGEAERDAGIRELAEETGITDSSVKDCSLVYAKTSYYPDKSKSVSKFLYTIHLNYVPDVTLSWEHSKYEWMDLETIKKGVEFRPFYKEAIEYGFSSGLL